MERRPNLHKERISGSDDLIQWGTGGDILEVLAPVGDSLYTFDELLFFVIGIFLENARGEWGLRQKKWRGALENSSHWVMVRDGVVREDQCIQEGKVRHQAGERKDVVQPCFAIPGGHWGIGYTDEWRDVLTYRFPLVRTGGIPLPW